MKPTFSIILIIAFLSMLTPSFATSPSGDSSRRKTTFLKPRGYNGVGLFLFDGQYNISDGAGAPVPGCPDNGFICDGAFFWENIVRRSPARSRRMGDAYMQRAWGINVTSDVEAGRLSVFNGYLDPRANYRARMLPGLNIHPLGWQVHDQVFLYTNLVPRSINGIDIRAGDAFAHGQYVIQKSFLRNGRVINRNKFVVIKYESLSPFSLPSTTPTAATCRIRSSPWGRGLAALTVFRVATGFEMDVFHVRNFQTYDGSTGTGRYPGVFNV